MKVLSSTSIYGIRALIFLAGRKNQGEFINIRDMAEELKISFHFLTKILQSLTRQNILESYRGPNGGIMLKKDPRNIFLIDLVHILEGDDFFDSCLLGLPGCGHFAPCPVHDFWQISKAAMKSEFAATSLAALSEKVSDKRLRLVG